jgi:hypothetical protein
VPAVGLCLIVLGVALIIVNNEVSSLPAGWTILVGFVLMGGGLSVLSQWR